MADSIEKRVRDQAGVVANMMMAAPTDSEDAEAAE